MSNQRHARQTILPEIGEEGQKKLKNASVLCIGAGGLGSPVLTYLAAAGIGHIGIADFDDVEESNFNRQTLFSILDIDVNKAESAKRNLLKSHPHTHIETFTEGLNASNAEELFQRFDVIIDGSDNFETKFLINDTSLKTQTPWVYGAIQSFDGQACIFDGKKSPCYRCIVPQKPQSPIQNCAEAGVIGALAGIVGTTQAMQAIQLIVGHSSFEPLIGKIWTIDARTMQSYIRQIPQREDCLCHKQPNDITLPTEQKACKPPPSISCKELQDTQGYHLLDVRQPHVFQDGAIPESKNIPLTELQEWSKNQSSHIKNNETIVVYCQQGITSKEAIKQLNSAGFKNIYNLSGGYNHWLKAYN